MNKRLHLSRRDFLKIGGGAVAAAAGVRLLPKWAQRAIFRPASVAEAQTTPTYHLAATDGFVYLPGSVPNPMGPSSPFVPDPLAPAPFTTWGFGFRNVTGLSDQLVLDQKNKFQASAPLLWIDQEQDSTIKLTDLGFTIRPDLTDGHTIHFHGFRNAIPLFDGVPEMSIAVPIGRNFTYFYRPHDPGTYMWHCHFEDVEHVQMGMTGIIFVRPTMGPKFAYNHASTAFDREFAMFLSEWWAEAHYRGAHIQEHDWSEYNPDYWLLNGRVYPDTLAPNGGGTDTVTGDLIPPPGRPDLKYQPISSLVRANAGDKVLLRFVDLGYQQHAMTLAGIAMKVVGKDATLLRNGSTDLSYTTDTIYIGPGESYDAIFTAPAFDGTAPTFTDSIGTHNKYLLYNRNYGYLHNPGVAGLGGQMTEIRVYAGGVPVQTVPNT